MNLDWTHILGLLLGGGSCLYLLIDKLFSRRQSNANARDTEVVTFDKEMDAIRRIKLDMIADVQEMREQLKKEQALAQESVSGELNNLKKKVEEEQALAKKREDLLLKQIGVLNSTIQGQAKQINKMLMYWQLLCDRDCDKRHVPKCPLNKLEDGSSKTV